MPTSDPSSEKFNKGKPSAALGSTAASNSNKKAAATGDPSCLSSPPTPMESSVPTSLAAASGPRTSLEKRSRAKVAHHLHDDASHDNETLDTVESWDVSNSSPGAFPVQGTIHETTTDPDDRQETIEDLEDDPCQLIVAAEVVRDEEEMVAEIKERLEKEIQKEVEMRLVTESQQTTVVAEAVQASLEDPKAAPSWTRWTCLLLAVILVIVATITTAVVVTSKSNDTNTNSNTTTSSSLVVVCSGTTPIDKGQTVISSWIDPMNKSNALIRSSACISKQISGPNTWFSLIGTGDIFAVSTCSKDLTFDSAILVATGSCNNLQCVGYGDFTRGECPQSSHGAATVLFRTDVDVPYYIAVEALNNPSQWNFTLSITTVTESPLNSDCSNAVVIQPGKLSRLPGSITNATHDIHFTYPCATTGDLPSVWYSVLGTGDVFDVSTCTKDLNFDARLSVSTGSCESPECLDSVTNNQYNCLDTQHIAATVSFQSEVGVKYFVEVHPAVGKSPNGDFTLLVSSGPRPVNDDCSSATIVEAGNTSVSGSILYSSSDPNMNVPCSYGGGDSQIVWYSMIGTGDIYSLSTCSSGLKFDSALSVLTGTCDHLECMIRSKDAQDACPESSFKAARTLLSTEVGVEYIIAIEAMNYVWEGDFVLDVKTVQPLSNDDCPGAIDVQPNNGTLYGTTKAATPSLQSSTGSISYPSPDLWYRIVGSGTTTVASLCSAATTYDSYIEVYQAEGETCNQTLIGDNDDSCGDSSELLWFAAKGVTYYIRVAGCYDSGPFGLTVTTMS